MLYYGFGEQARHGHMSDEYKDRYIIRTLLKTPPWYYRQYNTTVSSNTELNKRVVRSNITKDLPNTHRRSTAETAMNPIGQTFPVIHIHLGGNSEQGLCRLGGPHCCGVDGARFFAYFFLRTFFLRTIFSITHD